MPSKSLVELEANRSPPVAKKTDIKDFIAIPISVLSLGVSALSFYMTQIEEDYASFSVSDTAPSVYHHNTAKQGENPQYDTEFRISPNVTILNQGNRPISVRSAVGFVKTDLSTSACINVNNYDKLVSVAINHGAFFSSTPNMQLTSENKPKNDAVISQDNIQSIIPVLVLQPGPDDEAKGKFGGTLFLEITFTWLSGETMAQNISLSRFEFTYKRGDHDAYWSPSSLTDCDKELGTPKRIK